MALNDLEPHVPNRDELLIELDRLLLGKKWQGGAGGISSHGGFGTIDIWSEFRGSLGLRWLQFQRTPPLSGWVYAATFPDGRTETGLLSESTLGALLKGVGIQVNEDGAA